MAAVSAFDEIQQLIGMDDFKRLSARLRQVAENRRRLQGVTVPLPNYLFAADAGCGVSTHLRMLTRQLQEDGLMRFAGERPCFEWQLAEDENGQAVKPLLRRLRAMAGFHSRYYGVIGLEIDAWIGREEQPEFVRLLELVKDLRREVVFVFIVRRRTEARLASLMGALNSCGPLETVNFCLPTPEQLTEYLVKFLDRRGFAVSRPARAELPAIMQKLSAIEGIDGFSTLNHLADEIIYNVCSTGRVAAPTIMKEDLAFITAEQGYLDRQIVWHTDARIGFRR